MSEELKVLGCPFCGADASTHTYTTESLFSHDQVEFLTIACDDCDVFVTGEQQEELRERWNRRASAPTPPASNGEVERLLGDLKRQLRIANAYADEANQKDPLPSVWQLQNAHIHDQVSRLEAALGSDAGREGV